MPRMFNFAWVDASETTFDDVAHAREDERVYSYEFTHSEGDFAALQITIKNPRVGLLSLGRKTWLWFSATVSGVTTPIFFGRLNGIPQNVFQDTIVLEFTARPADYADKKIALAETLKVAPFWDPLFIREDAFDDPDVVLEARSALWHVDPVTHEVTISDLIVGEDGTVLFTGDDYYDEDMELTIGNTPARSATVTSSIQWDNQGAGSMDITGFLLQAFNGSGGGEFSGLISSYTFQGFFNSWPQTGDEFGSGWFMRASLLVNVTGEHVPPAVKKADLVNIDDWEFPTNLPYGSLMLAGPAIVGRFGFAPEPLPSSMTYVPLGWGAPTFILGYAATRSYTENVTLTIQCATQDVTTAVDEDDVINLNITSNSASAMLLGEIPIGDVRRRSYVLTDRGQQSMAHLIAIARANLIARNRAIKLVFETNFAHVMTCSLRKNAVVLNPRFPGGTITGKIIGVQHSLDGSNGALRAHVTVASCAGLGGDPYVASDGDPTYVEEGYVTLGYQQYLETILVLSTEDISYTIDPFEPNDDGIDFSSPLDPLEMIRYLHIENSAGEQSAAVINTAGHITPATYGVQASTSYDEAQVRQIISDMPTKVQLQLAPLMTGPFETDVHVTVSDLIIPKQIDLEAEAIS